MTPEQLAEMRDDEFCASLRATARTMELMGRVSEAREVREAVGRIDAAAQRAERLLRDFELAMVAKNAEIGELTHRAERAEAALRKARVSVEFERDHYERGGYDALASASDDVLKEIDAALSTAPAPGSVTEGFEALRRIAGDDLPEPDMPDAGGAE